MSRFNTPLETNVVLFGRLDSRLWVVNILQSSGLFLAVEKGEDGADRLLFTRHLLQEIANAAKRLRPLSVTINMYTFEQRKPMLVEKFSAFLWVFPKEARRALCCYRPVTRWTERDRRSREARVREQQK